MIGDSAQGFLPKAGAYTGMVIMDILTTIFWISSFWIAYVFFGYPILLRVLSSIAPKRVKVQDDFCPSVSMIIAAYNEEAVIRRKLEETLETDYPLDKLEVLVVTDGSTDGTDAIVREFEERGITLVDHPENRGKSTAVNDAVAQAKHDILVFSDASGIYNPEAIGSLVRNFSDPEVGCVSGKVIYSKEHDATSKGFGLYQKFVVNLRQSENLVGSQTSVSGSIHALRRELYYKVPGHQTADLMQAVHTVLNGFRGVYEAKATSIEEPRTDNSSEFTSRVRIGVRCLSGMGDILSGLTRKKRFSYLFQIISHKFGRWWLWLPLLALFISSGLFVAETRSLESIFGLAFAGQSLFYILGILGLLTGKRRVGIPGLSQIAYFLLGNAAMAWAALRWMSGQRVSRWTPIR